MAGRGGSDGPESGFACERGEASDHGAAGVPPRAEMSSAPLANGRRVSAVSSHAPTRLDEFVALLSEAAVGDRIRAAIREETPVYARFADQSEEQHWADGIDTVLAMFIASIREGRGVSTEEEAAMEAIGRRRAEQANMTLDAIEASIRVAIATAYDVVLEYADLGSDEVRRALRELSRRLTTYGNRITAATLLAFLARKEELAESRARAGARLFDDVLGGGADAAEVRHRAAAQGIDLDAGWGAVLVTASARTRARTAEAALMSTLVRAIAVPMATAPVPHAVVVYPLPSDAETTTRHREIAAVAAATSAVMVTVGRCAGISELRRKYSSARSLLPYAPVLAGSDGPLNVNDVPELALLTSVTLAARQAYLDDVLGPIASVSPAKRRRLQKTVEAVARHGKAPKALSEETGFDIKTTRRHLDLFETLTGLCLDRPDHLRRLGLAVELEKLVRELPTAD